MASIETKPDIEVAFKVMGEPVPQGSVRAFVTKSGRPIITHSNRNTTEWRQRIARVAQDTRPNKWEMDRAILLDIVFLMPRPKSLPKKIIQDVKRPDLDKLVRAVMDALTGIFYQDDSQVTQLTASKNYTQKDDPPGVVIRIIGRSPLEETAYWWDEDL